MRFAFPYLDEYERLFGSEKLDRYLASWETSSRELRADETQWLSLAFLEALCEELVRESGSDEVVARCGRLGVTRKYIGALYPVLRVLGSPKQLYGRLEKLSETVNKVNRVRSQHTGRGSARLVYWPGEVAETSEHVCTARKAQLAAIPSVWGLPDARLTETECIHEGGAACRYDVQWQQRVYAVGGVLGLTVGVATMVLHGLSFPGSITPFLLFALLCLATGMLVDALRRNRETRRFSREQNQALTSMLEASNAHFDRILHETKRRYEAEQQATELQRQLDQSQKLETVGRLAGGIAHDFNNLLTVINSYAEFAAGGLRADDPLKADLQQIKEAGDRAAKLTRQLLAFSRKQVMKPRVLDLNGVVSGLHSMLRRLIGEDVALSIELAPELWRVSADPGQIEQVLMNLAVNARDAMPEGGELTIETANVELDEDVARRRADIDAGAYVRISVADSGTGMSAEIREHVFEPFFTTKEKERGTGLGLATVYGIVKQSRGDICVDSDEGRGSTFEIYLPKVDQEIAESALAASATSDPRGDETVLVVEDEAAVRELTRRILADAGYHPIVAASAEEAVTACEQSAEELQLLLTDVVMPVMSGKALVERLETICPGIPVLYMSGYTDDTIGHHGVLGPGTHFIAKPFSGPQLLEKIRSVLDRPER